MLALVVGLLAVGLAAPGLADDHRAPVWQPPDGALSDDRVAIYLDSATPREWIGQGFNYLYTLDNARISITHEEDPARVIVDMRGDQWWRGVFAMPEDRDRVEPGFYRPAVTYPKQDPSDPGMRWFGDGRGCDVVGWFAVDEITFEDGELTGLRLRFEQRCYDRGRPPLHGEIRYVTGDTADLPNPQPVRAGTWEPSQEVPDGDYFAVEGDEDDFVSWGENHVYTPEDTTFVVGHLDWDRHQVRVSAGGYRMYFAFPEAHERLRPGLYLHLLEAPHHNPALGGIAISNGRACTDSYGWYVVDDVAYEGDEIVRLLLRFEQRCGPLGPPLRGEIRWRTDAERTPAQTDERMPEPQDPFALGPPPLYDDVRADSPHAEAIGLTTLFGIATGYPDGSFRPHEHVTRGQIASFLDRGLRYSASFVGPSFRDVEGTAHETAVDAFAAAGVVEGYPDGTFGPHQPVTRAQMATYLAQALQLPPASEHAPEFDDVEDGVHSDAIARVAYARLARGYDDGTFRPDEQVTRAQMATFVSRAVLTNGY